MCYAVRSYFESLLCSLSLCICRLRVKGPLKAFSLALQCAWDETSDKSHPFLWVNRRSWRGAGSGTSPPSPLLCFPAWCWPWLLGPGEQWPTDRVAAVALWHQGPCCPPGSGSGSGGASLAPSPRPACRVLPDPSRMKSLQLCCYTGKTLPPAGTTAPALFNFSCFSP